MISDHEYYFTNIYFRAYYESIIFDFVFNASASANSKMANEVVDRILSVVTKSISLQV